MLDLQPHHRQAVLGILGRIVPDARVWAYGSRVTGRARRYSDLDLAVEAGHELGFGELGALREAFSESDLPMMVDVIDLRRVSPEFRTIVERERVRLV